MILRPFNALLSYASYSTHDIDVVISELGDDANVMADSGAFTARHQGTPVDVHAYAEWLKRWGHVFKIYPNLDELHDVPLSIANQQAIESHGLTPCPVFHTGEPWRVLEAYCERHSYVMLGGMVGQPAMIMHWLERCFRIGDQHSTRFHGFGLTKHAALRAFPFFSVDSTSWASGHWYGQVRIWDSKLAKVVSFKAYNPKTVASHLATLSRYGLNPIAFSDKRHSTVENFIRVAACSFYDLESFIRKLHGPITPPAGFEHLTPGLHIHLVSGAPRDLPRAREAVRSYVTSTPYVPPVTGMTLAEKAAVA